MSDQGLVSSSKDVNAVFRALASKYAVEVPANWQVQSCVAPAISGVCLCPGTKYSELSDNIIPLFPWRYERRFAELSKLVSTRTVEDVVMSRFSCSDRLGSSLREILYREFDLLEWLNDSPIVSLYASIADNLFANVLVRLENGCVCSVEVGTTLPDDCDSAPIDRHELIGRRGVASDRVVDTQVPQSSVYLYKQGTTNCYTDVDSELFGLENNEINLVRAAYALLLALKAGTVDEEIQALRRRHDHLTDWVQKVFESNATGKHLSAEGALA